MDVVIKSLQSIYQRDLEKLRDEIELYSSEESLWLIDGKIANSGGNLCLHLVGNLRHFIGAVIGGPGYVRDRELEFTTKGTPRAELLAAIDETISEVLNGLNKLRPEQLDEEYPLIVFTEMGPMTTGYFLIHLATHLGYHLGQINYHRRLLDR